MKHCFFLVCFLCICLCLSGCVGTAVDTSAAIAETDGQTTFDTSGTLQTEQVTTSGGGEEVFDSITYPFWLSDTMYNECVTMQVREDGSIYAKSLYVPTELISVYDVTLKKEYKRGVDYEWDAGTNVIKWLEGSSIEYFTVNDLAGIDEDGKKVKEWGNAADGWTESNPWDSLGRARFGNCLYCVSEFFYKKQIAVTYKFEKSDVEVAFTGYSGDSLPKTMSKLSAGEELRVVVFGDSIWEGCDASSLYGREPKQPTLASLVSSGLTEKYGSRIKLFNVSLGGASSVWGVENVEKLVPSKRPDLVIIGFGMNDGTLDVSSTNANIKKVMTAIRKTCPDCEFIVCDTILPNTASGFCNHQPDYPKSMKKLAGDGVVFIDIFSVHNDILKYKDYASTSGNNVNHPNDWFIRVYAMNVLAALIDYGG